MRTSIADCRDADLGRFRYHTGAQPTRLAPDEPCPPLFRDVGFEAMSRFLRGDLQRLCGPISPITYLRTADYREPYHDFGRTGRIMLLSSGNLRPWHSGIETIYISPRETPVDVERMVFIPAEVTLDDAAVRLAEAGDPHDVADVFGPRDYADAKRETLARLDDLEQTHRETERLAAPLRRLFQSMDERDRVRARNWMERTRLSETDLCTAWHHLPAERRKFIQHVLQESSGELT